MNPVTSKGTTLVSGASAGIGAALVALQQEEVATLPSLHEGRQRTRFEAARHALALRFRIDAREAA